MTPSLLECIDAFPRRRVLVVGDAILDHYVVGRVSRTSPEAPVPVVAVESERWLPGGAANVARNLAALGARVVFVSCCGRDEAGGKLEELLKDEEGLRTTFVRIAGRPTTLKTRAMAQGQQMLRLDREVSTPVDSDAEEKLIAAVQRHVERVDGVILSDYGKGVLTPRVVSSIIGLAMQAGIEVSVDPKGTDYRRYRGADIVTPNRKEAQEASGIAIRDDATTAEAARVLQKQIGGKAVVVTLGAHGVAVYPKGGKPLRISARAREVFDVTGAGDTFIAAMSLARFGGTEFDRAAEVGNVAAGIVVGRAGVATVTREELRREVLGEAANRKWLGARELGEVRSSLALAGRRFVFTNGCFDVLNVRHIRLLEQARALGDVLCVALNSDESVRRIKGAPRPLLTASERVDLISSLPYVDYVTVFDSETPNHLLRALRPDVLVKGDIAQEVVGREIVEEYGGEVRQLDPDLGPSGDELVRRAMEAAPARRGKKRS